MSQSILTSDAAVDADETLTTAAHAEVPSAGVVESAIMYAEAHSLAVFPCRKGEKMPATPNGFKDAVSDAESIRSLFHEGHNLAVRTGTASGVFVLDVDEPGGGDTLSKLEAENGSLPDTVSATTPRGGQHYYFKLPSGSEIKCSAGKIGHKLDIRGEGGYVVAPPSSTATGEYLWAEGCGIDEMDVAEAPTWLLDLVSGSAPASAGNQGLLSLPQWPEEGEILEGSRNAALASLAGTMRWKGAGEASILAALNSENSERCKPPLSAKEVQQIAASVARYAPSGANQFTDASLPYREFPSDALPGCLADFVENGAATIGCDASYIALPLLAGLASAIGNSCRIELKAGWREPAIIWTAIVGNSGTMKSPAIELALRPVRERQEAALAAYDFALTDYNANYQVYENELASWRKSKGGALPPAEPEKPTFSRTWADDLTVEALAVLLLEQPRGLLVACDELASWLGGFDRYSQGSGGDAARWLEMHGGRQMVVDRKTGEPKTFCIPQASVSVTGGIQPGVLNRALGQHHRESGMAARLLVANPPRVPKRWSETEIDANVAAKLATVYNRLYGLSDRAAAGDDLNSPQVLKLSPEAKTAWVEFYNNHAFEQNALEGDLAAAYSKLEGYAARFALVLHLADWASGPEQPVPSVTLESLKRAIRLVTWFKYETRRVYGRFSATQEEQDDLATLEKVQSLGGQASPRDLMRKSRAYGSADVAEKALGRLVEIGKGEWVTEQPSSAGGRPKRSLRLLTAEGADETGETSS